MLSGNIEVRRADELSKTCPNCGLAGTKYVYWIPPKPKRKEFGRVHVIVGMYCERCNVVFIVDEPWRKLEEFS